MKKKAILLFLAMLTGVPTVSAQVMDMRAFSRQRGFRAYQAKPLRKQTVAPQQRGSNENSSLQSREAVSDEAKETSKSEEKVDQTNEIEQYIANNPQVKPDI